MQWDAIIGVIIGGFLGGGAQILHSYYQRFNDMRNLAGSFGGEIEAIARLIERRNYVEQFEKFSQAIRTRPDQPVQISDVVAISARQNYFEVFGSNSARIGLLGRHARDIAYFYSLAKGALDTNAGLKRLQDVLFKGEHLTGIRGWLADVHSSVARDMKELLELSARLGPELSRVSSLRFVSHIFRGRL
jgi:hypothetical protein